MFARAHFLRLQSSNVRAQKHFYINENGSSIGIVRGRTTMDFRRRINWTSVALVVVLAIGMPWTAGAQGQRGAVAEPYTPAANAKDLKAVLFNWMWGMGMLKGHDERDMVASLEYQ